MLDYQTDLVVAGLASRHAARWSHRNREAVVTADARLDWTTLDDRSRRIAEGLRRHGVGAGDVVGMFLPNRAEFFELVLALSSLGAIAAPQSYRSSPFELAHGLRSTGASMLVVEDGELARRAEAAFEQLDERPTVVQIGGDDDGYASLVGSPPLDSDWPAPAEDDAIWLAATGGTSGLPKLVRVPHRVLVQMWLYVAVEFGIGRNDTMLIPGPLHHGLGFGFALQQLYVGGKVAVLREFDAEAALRTIARERVTVLPAAPTILTMLLDHPVLPTLDLSSLRMIVSAGSPLLTPTKRRLLDRLPGVELYEHYGATEAGFFTVLRPEDQLRKERSCGFAFFGSELRVLVDGRDAEPGEVGLVYKRGLVQGGGYVGNPDATEAMFHDRWATVGDMGHLDDEGYLHLVDRKSDMIVTGGVNVYPTEIEETIASLPQVAEVAVIGIPDDTWGETVRAVVVRRPGATLEADDVVAVCAARLAAYKRPRSVEFVESLPKSAAGKVLRRELRAAAWAGHERSL